VACTLTFLNNLQLYHFCLRPDLGHHSRRLLPLPPSLQKLASGTPQNYSTILGEMTFSLLMRTKNSSSTLKSSSLSSPNQFHSQFIKLQWPEPRFITSNNNGYLKFEYHDFTRQQFQRLNTRQVYFFLWHNFQRHGLQALLLPPWVRDLGSCHRLAWHFNSWATMKTACRGYGGSHGEMFTGQARK